MWRSALAYAPSDLSGVLSRAMRGVYLARWSRLLRSWKERKVRVWCRLKKFVAGSKLPELFWVKLYHYERFGCGLPSWLGPRTAPTPTLPRDTGGRGKRGTGGGGRYAGPNPIRSKNRSVLIAPL